MYAVGQPEKSFSSETPIRFALQNSFFYLLQKTGEAAGEGTHLRRQLGRRESPRHICFV